MRKFLALLLACVITMAILAGCAPAKPSGQIVVGDISQMDANMMARLDKRLG